MTHHTLTERSVSIADVEAFRTHILAWGRSPNTARAYSRDLTMLVQEVPDLTTANYSNAAAGWLTSHRADWSAATTKRRLASLNQFAEFLGVEGLANYRRPVDVPKTYTGIDIEAVRDVLNKLREVDLGLSITESRDAYAMISLCGAAGLRIGEAVAVELDHLTPDADTFQLYVHGKGGRDRIVPFPPLHYGYLIGFGGARLHGVASTDTARWLVHKTFERAGYSRVESHQLRHAYATAVFDQTKDIVLVQRLLGHANVTTTQRYISTTYGQQAAAVTALGV